LYLEPQFTQFENVLKSSPNAYAVVKGGQSFPDINGMVFFYQLTDGALVIAQVNGLPQVEGNCAVNVFGFHIHEGRSCDGTPEFPFASSGPHYNPKSCPHPAHAGDLPPLFGNHGYAFMAVITNRFSVNEIVGRTVIVHGSPDDFTTQPAGNSGAKIACGQIVRNTR
jgi:Cu/Zn superoxide dismutase